MPAPQIARALLEQRAIQVTDEVDDGRRVLNPEATAAAQEKGAAMQERFAEWCWQQPARAAQLLEEYNRRFNAIVLRVICSAPRSVADVAVGPVGASEATRILRASST